MSIAESAIVLPERDIVHINAAVRLEPKALLPEALAFLKVLAWDVCSQFYLLFTLNQAATLESLAL